MEDTIEKNKNYIKKTCESQIKWPFNDLDLAIPLPLRLPPPSISILCHQSYSPELTIPTCQHLNPRISWWSNGHVLFSTNPSAYPPTLNVTNPSIYTSPFLALISQENFLNFPTHTHTTPKRKFSNNIFIPLIPTQPNPESNICSQFVPFPFRWITFLTAIHL